MHFIYDILYSNAYPFEVATTAINKGIINDVVILNAKAAWLTDIIITDIRAFVAFVDDQNSIITADVESPSIDTPYELTDATGPRGSIIFGNLVGYSINISAQHLKLADGICIAQVTKTSEDIYGDNRDRYDIIFTGSLVGSYNNDTGMISLGVDESLFVNETAVQTTGLNINGNGVRSLAGVTSDSNKNIEINIPGAGFEPVTYKGEVIGLKLVTVNIPGCDTTDVIKDNITCSIMDGSTTNYPLDDIICDSDVPICPEEWEK